jgi:hypothetical protein
MSGYNADYSSPQSPSVMTTVVYGLPRKPNTGLTPLRSLRRLVQPVIEPVSLAEAKAHVRVDTEADDSYIQGLISSARAYCEDILDATFVTTTWEAKYNAFPLWEIVLPRPPMQAATVTVLYRDQEGVTNTLVSTSEAFQVDSAVVPGRIYPPYAGFWPPVRGDENSVTVQWKAGFGDSKDSVNPMIRHAILLLVGHWYVNREAVGSGESLPLAFQTLIQAADFGVYR